MTNVLRALVPARMRAGIRQVVQPRLHAVKSSLLNLLRDDYTRAYTSPVSPLGVLIWETTRYRAASKGLFLTKNEYRLGTYRGRHVGERAFILGNGPSLNSCDLSLLQNEVTFGVNSIFLNYGNMGFHPTYYVVEDVLVAEDRSGQINHYHGPTKLFGNYLRYCLSDSDDVIWLNVRIRYDDYPDFPNFSHDALRMVWTGGTVTYICLQLAYYMGFTTLYLIGFDHSYTIPPDAGVNGAVIQSQSDDPNHFSPEYFGKGYRWHDPRVDRMEKAYVRAKKIFESSERKIYNATVGGQLEVFERVDYKSLFTG